MPLSAPLAPIFQALATRAVYSSTAPEGAFGSVTISTDACTISGTYCCRYVLLPLAKPGETSLVRSSNQCAGGGGTGSSGRLGRKAAAMPCSTNIVAPAATPAP